MGGVQSLRKLCVFSLPPKSVQWIRVNSFLLGPHRDLCSRTYCDYLGDIDRMAEFGHLYCLISYYLRGSQIMKRTCASAAKRGHVHILEWLWKNNIRWDWRCEVWAAAHNQFRTLRWIYMRKDKEELHRKVIFCACATENIFG